MPIQIDLSGKVVLVTGASRGIGAEVARVLARAGAYVFVNGRDEKVLHTLGEEIEETVKPLAFDVSNPKAVEKAFIKLFKETKKPDTLLNKTGILDDALIGMVSEKQIERTFATNTFSVLYTSQYAAQMVRHGGGGRIINVSSIIGRVGNRGAGSVCR